MKNLLMLAVAAGGLMLATSSEANAHDWNRRGRSNFGISLNFGAPSYYGYSRSFAPYRSRSYSRVSPTPYFGRSYYSGYRSFRPSYGFGGYRGYGYCR